MTNHQTIQSSKQEHDADRGISRSYNCYSLSNDSILTSMREGESLGHRRRCTLLIIPSAFAHAIPLQKSDVVKMTLEGKTVRLEKV